MTTGYKKDIVMLVVVVVVVVVGVVSRKYNDNIYVSFILKNKYVDIKIYSYTCIKLWLLL